MEIAKVYNPKDIEEKWYNFWLEKGFFSSQPAKGKKPFTIVIPPPNVTGSLHMGHALNNTLQDAIIRFRRMQGYNACWVPGTDHGGIATQNVVEKMLLKEGKTRQDIGREKFVEYLWQWQKESGEIILHQLKKLGCSCDWKRQRFTMDEICSKAVLNAFVELYNRGLIYRGSRLVNWCVRCGTALADIEVEYKEEKSHLWYIKYPLKPITNYPSSEADLLRRTGQLPITSFIVVATTRPETMLGDTAVAVNPKDKRYKNLVGEKIILPLMNREIPIIADELVDSSFGTGAVKVTPAHDPVDFEIAERHHLPQVTVIDSLGKMTEVTGKYKNLDRYLCRETVVKDLQKLGYLEKIEEYSHRVGHCYRCATVIEPLISEQWFLKTASLAEKAISSTKKGKIKFFPQRWLEPYLEWLKNLRDWCISRQIWWGHRIPVYYCTREVQSKEDSNLSTYQPINLSTISCPPIVSIEKPEKCPSCGNTNIVQDPDVLDTWFSSALWPFSVFGWPLRAAKSEEQRANSENTSSLNRLIAPSLGELDYYYPTSVLVTGYEILYLWVARMVMMGLELVGGVPFENVYIHGIVRDVTGRKMSKSLGNVIDPLEIMKNCGTDALRFALVSTGVTGQDLRLSEDSFVMARNFANKLWNASRFVLMNLEGFTYQPISLSTDQLDLSSRWIISEYQRLVNSATQNLENYQLSEAGRIIYQFFWHKYCDWYIELSKIYLHPQSPTRSFTQNVLVYVLEGTLRLLHPFMPFITEEIWQNLKEITELPNHLHPAPKNGAGQAHLPGSIMVSDWPKSNEKMIDEKTEKEIELLIEIICIVRNLRSEVEISPSKKIELIFKVGTKEKESMLSLYSPEILSSTNSEKITFSSIKPKNALFALVGDVEIYLPLSRINFEKERERLNKEIAKINYELERINQKLADKNFLAKANPQAIKKIEEKMKEYEEKKKKLEEKIVSSRWT